MSQIENFFRSLLLNAEIELNGCAVYDLQVKNPDFYKRVLRDRSLGLGESYVDGWWDGAEPDSYLQTAFCFT